MSTPTPITATITVVDIYAKVIEMQTQLAIMNEKLADLPDHEQRIRLLEVAKAKIYGVAIAVSAVISGMTTWIVSTGIHHP